jgi:hypothetical protein
MFGGHPFPRTGRGHYQRGFGSVDKIGEDFWRVLPSRTTTAWIPG